MGLQKGGGIVMQMTPAMIFDYMGILMDKEAMADQDFTINVTLSDLKQQHVLHAKNGVLLVYENTRREDADVSITCPKNALLYSLMNNVRALDGVPMEGNVGLITLFAQSMNQVPVQGTVPFNIIEP